MVEQEKFSNGDVYEYLYTRIDEKFNEVSNRLEKFIANGEIEESNSSMSLNFN